MSENPFQSPTHQQTKQPPMEQRSFGRGYVQQIPVIASLFIVQGLLLLVFSALMVFYAVMFSNLDSFIPPNPNQPAEVDEIMDMQKKIIPAITGVFAAVVAVIAILHFVAAYLNFNYKGRIFAIVTMVLGALSSLMTCYCLPTAVGLAIYGMIVYLNPAVIHAFALGKSGKKKTEILSQFPY